MVTILIDTFTAERFTFSNQFEADEFIESYSHPERLIVKRVKGALK